jgi:hypothetical protein
VKWSRFAGKRVKVEVGESEHWRARIELHVTREKK